eukprot:TRINITY_DN28579_c0_g2_i1.p1 TRINITY_DN28579_c0_g2~~TRINITY_DN28579_c0_g2_i1.p1  ORF type:complete len:420 (+),score=98.03 TRINITY_DN28579_c0_g2_i1:84-1262(+)
MHGRRSQVPEEQQQEYLQVRPVEDILTDIESGRDSLRKASVQVGNAGGVQELLLEDENEQRSLLLPRERSPAESRKLAAAAGYPVAAKLLPEPRPKAAGVHVVVQRCLRACLVDETFDTWTEIGRGLVIYVAFSRGSVSEAGTMSEATVRSLRQIAKTLLTAPLSSGESGDAQSVVKLCLQGEAQGLMVLPQASLISELECGETILKHDRQCDGLIAAALLQVFVNSLQTVACELVCTAGPKHSVQSYEALLAKKALDSLVPPGEFFKQGEHLGKYSRYDERGIPTHREDGSELPTGVFRDLVRMYEAQVTKTRYCRAMTAAAEAAVTEGLSPKSPHGKMLMFKDDIGDVEGDEEAVMVPGGACMPCIASGNFRGKESFTLTSVGPPQVFDF